MKIPKPRRLQDWYKRMLEIARCEQIIYDFKVQTIFFSWYYFDCLYFRVESRHPAILTIDVNQNDIWLNTLVIFSLKKLEACRTIAGVYIRVSKTRNWIMCIECQLVNNYISSKQ